MSILGFLARIDQEQRVYVENIVNKTSFHLLVRKCLIAAFAENEAPQDNPEGVLNINVLSDCAKFIGFLVMQEDEILINKIIEMMPEAHRYMLEILDI